MLEQSTQVLVVGSGVTGATTASRLVHSGVEDVICTEARSVVGGNLVSREADGYLWEEGPNTFQPTPAILRLASELDLLDDLVLADHRLPRFVLWNDELYPLPMTLKDIVADFKLLSLGGKLRAAWGALGLVAPAAREGKAPGDDSQVIRLRPEDESVQDFVTRHLGREAFLKLIDPFVSGVYAGDASKLVMAAAFKRVFALQQLGGTPGILEGALIRIGQRRQQANPEIDADLPKIKSGSLGSFRHGLQQMPLKVQQMLGEKRMRTNHKP